MGKRAGAALTLLALAWCGGTSALAASSPDAQATHTYLLARLRLLTALAHDESGARAAEITAAKRIASECPGVLSGLPKESTPGTAAALTPRLKGENARLHRQKQLIVEELDAAFARPGYNSYRKAEEAYDAEVRGLSWSDPTIATTLQAESTTSLEAATAAAPSFCADASAWAHSGFRALPAASLELEASREAQDRSDRDQGLPWARC